MSNADGGREVLARIESVLTSYYASRVAQSFFTIYVVMSLSFVLIQMLPGGPQAALLNVLREKSLREGGSVNMRRVNALIETYSNINPSQPVWVQYVDYMASFLTGDLGTSIWYDDPVLEILLNALPWTLLVMGTGTINMFVFGIALGALMAYFESSISDMAITAWAILSSAIPYYVAAILLVLVFGYQLQWFPVRGQTNPSAVVGANWAFTAGTVRHAALPIISVVLTGFGLRALNMRANSIHVLGEDYIRVARLRGLNSYRIATRYVGRNALLPMYTGFLMSLGFMFGGAIILEQIFQYPGVGWYLFNSINTRDYPLMMGAFVLITTMVVISMFIADLTYSYIDPRVRSGGQESFSGGNVFMLLRRKLSELGGSEESTPETAEEQIAMTNGVGGPDVVADVIDEDVEESSGSKIVDRVRRLFDMWVRAPLGVIWSDVRGKISLTILTFYLLMGTVGVRVVGEPTTSGDRFVQPFQTLQYPLGTDLLGNGMFALMVHATPGMLKMIFAGAVFATSMATLVGILAGFKGGWVDRALMVVADIVLTIPGLPLVIVLASIFEPRNPYLVGLLLTVNAWGGTARQIRSQALSIRQSNYVEASRTMGLKLRTILGKDILPNVLPFALIKFVGAARRVIFSSVGLYFLGVLPFSSLNWGIVLNMAYTNGAPLLTMKAAHWLYVPVFTIMGISAALIMFAQAADQLTNPRVRARHAKTVEEGGEFVNA